LESAESGRSLVKYVDKAMFDAEAFDREAIERPKVYLLSATPDPLGAIAAFAMMYEGRVVRDLGEITDDERRSYWDDCFKTALQTPLEAFDLHFMVEGLTRASWDQMTRQRTATFAGESLRFAVKEPLTDAVRPGPLVKGDPGREQIWAEAVESIESAYNRLIAAGVPAEDARGLLPLNVLVRGHWKTNFRNFYAEVGKRLCTQAQWEWRMIHAEVRNAIAGYEAPDYLAPVASGNRRWNRNWQFEFIANSDVFKPICFQKGACMFKAKADRGCTIRERVEAGSFDLIKPEEWLLDPTAAWVR
jgi:flavin-dependent thymidylate synthase